jgi:hypothetical protein
VSDAQISPERQIAVGGQALTLDGSFRTLKAVQHGFGQDLLRVQARVLDMRQDEVARLLALASGLDEDAAGQMILDEVDVAGAAYQMLKAELMAWLAVAMTPRADREKKARALDALIDKLRSPASRGGSTSSSASAPSAGPRPRSGKATSGR